MFTGINFLAVLSAVVMTAGCSDKPVEPIAKSVPVKTVLAVGTDVAQTWDYAGEIKPRYETVLSFRVPGKISERLVNLGDTVTGSTVIARLDKADLKLASTQATAAVEQAKPQAKYGHD
jgi:multidrug efflux pump subunit AcrA (membrane-fusion protein)